MLNKWQIILSFICVTQFRSEYFVNSEPIIGGDDVYYERNDLTYVASIHRNINGRPLICGAVMVSLKAVLTAASCFGDDWTHHDFFLVKFATWERISLDSKNLKTIADIIRHQRYTGQQYENNLAIVRITSRFDENAFGRSFNIPRLPINNPNDRSLPSEGSIAGWGFTGYQDRPGVLYAANVPIIPPLNCHQYYEKNRRLITSETCCAGTEHEHGCDLDMGGGLVSSHTNANGDIEYTLIGIQVCGDDCKRSRGRPSIYALVRTSVSWITNNIQ